MPPVQNIQEEIKQGSKQAFKTLFHEYYTLLCSISYQYVKDTLASESIAEDTLYALWERRFELLPLDSLRGWLMRTVRNRSIDYLRTSHRDRFTALETAAQRCFIADDDLFESYVAAELEDHIQAHVDALPEECRRVFRMSRYDGLSYNEIAERLGVSVNTVKYHIKNALVILRKDLKPYLRVLFDIYVMQHFC